jgi:predicted Zn finger-like uncharacterized protein
LIITCAECATQFQLDETRVPESGIRVRCSVCKHAFFVGHPDALDDEAVDPVARVVREVLDGEPDAALEATHDLEGPDALAEVRVGGDEPAEESWEFGDGGPPPGASVPELRDRFDESFEAARDAVDDLLGGPWRTPEPAAPSFRVEEKDTAGDAWDPPARIDLPEETAPPPEDSLDFALSDSPDGEPSPSDEMPGLDEGRVEFDDGPAALDELDVGDDEDAAFENDALSDALESFDSAEDVDSDPFERGLSSPDRDDDHATAEAWGLDEPCDRDEPVPDAVLAPGRSEATRSAGAPIGFGAPPERGRSGMRILGWVAHAGNALGWGAVALLSAAALWASVAPRSAPTRAPGAQPLTGLEASDVEGRWVENATLGPLYVVSGELHNPGSEPKAPGAKLVVRLLDAQGVPIEAAAASVGPPLGALLLREGRPGDLRALGEAGALELARTAVAPGARIAFEAAVLDLPDGARRFDLATARP